MLHWQIQPEVKDQVLANVANLIDSVQDLLWSVDCDQNLLAFNRAFREDLPLEQRASVSPGLSLRELLPSRSASAWTRFFEKALSDGPHEVRHSLFGGRLLELSFNRILTDGEIKGVSVVGRFVQTGNTPQRLAGEPGTIAGPDGTCPIRGTTAATAARNAASGANEAGSDVREHSETEKELSHAIDSGELVLYYQPQVDHGQVIGAECLVRWNHPRRGLISPGEFVPMAEESGLILPLGKWVLESACTQLAAWAGRKNTADITISVNVGALQAAQSDFVEEVLAAINKFGANPANLELELTENTLVFSFDDVIAKMAALKSLGVRFALDDFGTGYSSLSYLKRLPLHQLKIDKSFIRDLLVDVNSGAITQTIISLGHAMGLSVIAEGVENEEQRDFLTAMGCHSFQGYLISPPLPLADFERMLPWRSPPRLQQR